jgi:hypothetical protein
MSSDANIAFDHQQWAQTASTHKDLIDTTSQQKEMQLQQ